MGKGASLRELNDAVFDAMVSGRGGSVYVGRGAGVYGFVGKWVPPGLVGYLMGVRRVGASQFGVFGGKVWSQKPKAIENRSGSGDEDRGDGSGSFKTDDGSDVEISGPATEGLGESGYVYPEREYVYPQREDGTFGNRL